MTKNKGKKTPSQEQALISKNKPSTETLEYPLFGEEKFKVLVNPNVSFVERTHMVKEIADMIFIAPSDTIDDFAPCFEKFAKRYAVVAHYTDFKLPKDVNACWLILNNTPLFDDVVKIVGSDINDIFKEADALVNARVRYLSCQNDFNKLINKVTAAVDSIGSKFTKDDLNSVMCALKNLTGITADKITEAVLKTENVKKDEKK